jgi:hypothetical protein
MNSGYTGYSMSNRAVEAYEDGEMPLSKWSKQLIIDEVVEYDHFTKEDLKKYTKKVLTEYFLERSSWHHTGKFCNETDFYSINSNRAENGSIDDLEELKDCYKKKIKKVEKLEIKKAKVKYLEWSGSRSHPKATEVEGYAVIIGNWAYFTSGNKKNLSSNGFKIIETYDRAPRGTANIFKRILNNLPDAVKKKI